MEATGICLLWIVPKLFFHSANVRLPQMRQPGVRRVPAPAEALSLLPMPPEEALGTAASHLEQEEQVGREAGPASAGEGHGERGARGGAQFCPQPRYVRSSLGRGVYLFEE